MIVYLRLAFGTLSCSRPAGRSRAHSASAARRRCSPGRWRRSSSRGRRCSRCTARSTWPSSCSRSSSSARSSSGAAREPGSRREPGSKVVLGSASSSAGSSGTSRARSPATASFHEARVRKLVDLDVTAPADRRRVQGRRPASRATRFRSGTSFSRSSRGSRASIRAWSCATSRRCSRRSPARVAWEAGVAVFGSRAAGASLLCAVARRLLLRPGARRLVGDARAARDRRAPAARARRRSRSSSPVAACAYRRDLRRARARRIRPTRSSCSCRSACTPSCVPASGGARRRCSPLRSCRPGLALLWLKPIVDETISHDPGPARAAARAPALRRPAGRRRTTTTTASPRRCSAGAAPSPSPRSSCCRSPGWRSRRRWATFALGGSARILLL